MHNNYTEKPCGNYEFLSPINKMDTPRCETESNINDKLSYLSITLLVSDHPVKLALDFSNRHNAQHRINIITSNQLHGLYNKVMYAP